MKAVRAVTAAGAAGIGGLEEPEGRDPDRVRRRRGQRALPQGLALPL